MKQQTPIKSDGSTPSIDLGSKYAQQLGLEGIEEYDASTAVEEAAGTAVEASTEEGGGKKGGNKKKKKKNNKKKH